MEKGKSLSFRIVKKVWGEKIVLNLWFLRMSWIWIKYLSMGNPLENFKCVCGGGYGPISVGNFRVRRLEQQVTLEYEFGILDCSQAFAIRYCMILNKLFKPPRPCFPHYKMTGILPAFFREEKHHWQDRRVRKPLAGSYSTGSWKNGQAQDWRGKGKAVRRRILN